MFGLENRFPIQFLALLMSLGSLSHWHGIQTKRYAPGGLDVGLERLCRFDKSSVDVSPSRKSLLNDPREYL